MLSKSKKWRKAAFVATVQVSDTTMLKKDIKPAT
jgi:hypothetical protein